MFLGVCKLYTSVSYFQVVSRSLVFTAQQRESAGFPACTGLSSLPPAMSDQPLLLDSF